MTDDEIWYRYNDVHYAPPLDELYRPCGKGQVKLELREFKVLRHTPKGVWLVYLIGTWTGGEEDKRFVLRDSRKRYACPTKEEALVSYTARKKSQVSKLRAQLSSAEEALGLVEPQGVLDAL